MVARPQRIRIKDEVGKRVAVENRRERGQRFVQDAGQPSAFRHGAPADAANISTRSA